MPALPPSSGGFKAADFPPGFQAYGPVDEPGAVGTEEWIAALRALQTAHKPGRAQAVAVQAEEYFDAYPHARRSIGYMLADLYVALGRYGDAYRLMAPLATADADEPTLLRCSVAAALRGEVYLGQRAYCVASVHRHWSDVDDRPEYLPRGESPDAVLTLSLLATAVEASSHHDVEVVRLYGGLALKRDPGNPLVCELFSDYALAERRLPEAIAYLERGLSRTSGDMAFAYRSSLKTYRRRLAEEQTAKPARSQSGPEVRRP